MFVGFIILLVIGLLSSHHSYLAHT